MIEVNIDTRKLCALNLLAARKDLRHYLCGVYVEATPTVTRIAATTGVLAGMCSNANPLDSNKMDGYSGPDSHYSLIIPSELIERLKPHKGTVADICTVLIETRPDPDPLQPATRHYTLRLWDGSLMPFNPVDGTFPDLRRVVPDGPASGAACNFDAELLALFTKVNKAISGTKTPGCMELGFRGETNAVTIKFPLVPEFVGLLMPRARRGDDPNPLTVHHEVQKWSAA